MNPIAYFARSVLPIGAVLMLAACGNGQAEQHDTAENDEDNQPPVPVETQVVTTGSIAASYSGTANLETDAEAEVVAKVGGEIIEILVEEGDIVIAGQVLARIDADRLRLELERNRANLAKLQQEYARNKDLFNRQLVSADAYEKIQFDMEALQAAYELAELELSYTEIRAPFDGVIAERLVKVGNTIGQNVATFRVSALDPLLAYLHVPERQFDKLRAGQPAVIFADALSGQAFPAVVARISPVIDPTTGTFKVTVEVTDAMGQLRPGMFARIGIQYDYHEDVVLVPRFAILDDEEQPLLFVIDEEEGVAKRVDVELGYAFDGQVEILSGLDAGSQIIVTGQAGLKDGAKVRVVSVDGELVLAEETEEGAEESTDETVADAD